MNAREREAAERLEQWLTEADFGSHGPKAAMMRHDIRTILAAVRQHERLANEGLTEKESRFIRDFWRPALEPKAGSISTIIAKIQAQLAAALQLRDLLLSDPPASREDVALAVREETAKTIVEYIEQQHAMVLSLFDIPDRHGAFVSDITSGIRRRFGLAAPQPAEPACQMCGGRGWDSQYPRSSVPLHCPSCAGR